MSTSPPTSLTERKAAIQQLLVDPPANYTGAIDSRLGPQTLAAFQRLAAAVDDVAIPFTSATSAGMPAKQTGDASDVHALGLVHNDWPLEANAASFFGYPPNLTQIETPYPLHLFSGNGQLVHQVTCNMKVAASLRRIFAAILAHYGSTEALDGTSPDIFDGIYNDRPVRGQSTGHSMHAYGAAIDLDAEHNVLGATHGAMPPAVVAIFKAEGWRWGGDYTGRKDWMHFEACR